MNTPVAFVTTHAVALREIDRERERQIDKWGPQSHPDGTGGPRLMRASEFARILCEAAFADDKGTWAHILTEEFFEAMAEADPEKLRTELIQVAAVAVAWVEDIDRR